MSIPKILTRYACALFGLVAWIPMPADAADSAKIDVKVATESPVLVGQRVDVQVKLMTSTTFASAPAFELPRMPNAFLMHVDDRPVLGTEDIDGTTYTTQLHSLALYCMKPGTCHVPAFTVRFEIASEPGQPPIEHRPQTSGFEVEAKMPAGAESLSTIICSEGLSITETWQPEPTSPVHVGASFKRQVTQTAPDVPAMIMPPIPLENVDGLTAYGQPPLVQDHAERGQSTGTRTDSVIYVCERPGTFTLPATVIPWWNLQNKELARETLPAITIEVQVATTGESPPPATAPASTSRWQTRSLVILGLIAVAAVAAFLTRHQWMAIAGRRQARYNASEQGLFEAIEHACNANDPIAAYNSLLKWLENRHEGPGPATIADDLLSRTADSEFRKQVSLLTDSVLNRAQSWRGSDLLTALKRFRSQSQHEERLAMHSDLPALNPG